jgi:glycosyltransferase involved in cell wall biosynthesis
MVQCTQSQRAALVIAVMEPGAEHGGIRRYAEVVADGLRGLDGIEVREVRRTPTATGPGAIVQARALLADLTGPGAALVSYTRWHTWSPGVMRVAQLTLVLLGLRGRSVTVLHDVYPPGKPQRVGWWAMAAVTLLSGQVVVHTEQERARLRGLPRARRVSVVPHFVVARDSLPARDAARAHYGVTDGVIVLALVGWLNPRKNYELAIDALPLVGPDSRLWLIGGADEHLRWYEDELREHARRLGVEDQVVFTGPVSEEELERRLSAVDVGLCPYRRISASGSVSTLLGARRPIVVTDLEFSRELHALAPDVVHLIGSLDPATLAATISEVVGRAPPKNAFAPILDSRSVAATAERYRALLASTV